MAASVRPAKIFEIYYWGAVCNELINDVRHFLMIFEPPIYHVRQFSIYNAQSLGVISDPVIYPKIRRH